MALGEVLPASIILRLTPDIATIIVSPAQLREAQGIAYVPFFPLGGFTPLQSDELNEVAAALHATPMQVALAWLLHRSPNILLIPGTSSRTYLRQNLATAQLQLPADALAKLDAIGNTTT